MEGKLVDESAFEGRVDFQQGGKNYRCQYDGAERWQVFRDSGDGFFYVGIVGAKRESTPDELWKNIDVITREWDD